MTARPVARSSVVRGVAAFAVFAGALSIGLAAAAPVAAHGDEGLLRVVGVQQGSEEHQVRLSVDYAYDDEHAVYRDGVLRLSGTSSEGVTLIPQTFSRTDVDGRYAADVVLPPPGIWTLRVEGDSPAADAQVSFDTAAPEWFEPDTARATGPEHSGVHVRWGWMLAGFAAVGAWFLALRWRRRSEGAALSDPG